MRGDVALENRERWFCSEIQAEAHEQIGKPLLLRIPSWKTSPGHIAISPLLKYEYSVTIGEPGRERMSPTSAFSRTLPELIGDKIGLRGSRKGDLLGGGEDTDHAGVVELQRGTGVFQGGSVALA